jgi:hypothetical protein
VVGLRTPKPSNWWRIPAIAKPLASVWRVIGFSASKCCKIGASVNACLTLWIAISAPPVHSHLSLNFFSKSAIGGYLGILLNEVPIEVHEAHQHLHVFRGCGCRPIFTLNSHFSALQFRPYSRSVSKNSAHVILVLRWILQIYEDIVEVVNNEVVHIRPQAIVHISLEPRPCISQPEWNDPILTSPVH